MADASPPLAADEAVIAAGLDPAFLPLMLAHRAKDLRDGIPFRLISGRRSSSHQASEYERYVMEMEAWKAGGEQGAKPRPAAKPGTSKHELGFAYDRVGPRNATEWARSAANAESLGLESGHRYNDPPHVEAAETFTALRTAVWLRVAAVAAAIAVAVATMAEA